MTESEANATSSPARGREMRQNLLGKLRPPPLVHTWEFWHDRQARQDHNNSSNTHTSTSTSTATSSDSTTSSTSYEARLVKLATINDVRDFWEVFNNFDITTLPLRDTIHLFHKGVKPVWEDARNERGGAWTFRVPKDKAGEVWKQVALMAVGEQLQEAVRSERVSKSHISLLFHLPSTPYIPFALVSLLPKSVGTRSGFGGRLREMNEGLLMTGQRSEMISAVYRSRCDSLRS